MTNNPDFTARPDTMSDGQHALTGPRLLAALTLIGDLDPVIANVLRDLHLRVYPGQPGDGDRSDYIVLDLHGVSIGALRREHDFYLHADTTETPDRVIAFEVNGSGERDHPVR
ncbi:hypothetical protein [Actinoplanes sp. NBRC 103695]|uniref:hypothetical protein n=1 Tax=Actinoplanes sp. NBRC 103695 TaxID=3032202 RepID=UPI0024A14F45|nr:hypothetical protein [Actinoplanes sp. NBRC 103695]GLZ01900.1 hypothetical protein Acsp02_91510 [Actinoplanes sp. NBRC 103695]